MELFPPSVRSLIVDDDLYMVVNDVVVNVLDLSCLYTPKWSGRRLNLIPATDATTVFITEAIA
jgi:hypothetical protein